MKEEGKARRRDEHSKSEKKKREIKSCCCCVYCIMLYPLSNTVKCLTSQWKLNGALKPNVKEK